MWHDLQEQAKVGRMLIGRTLQCDELALVWTIDRREVIHNSYRLVDGALTLRPDYFDMQGWPPGDHDLSTRLLRECCEHGGWCYGLFDGARLIGVARAGAPLHRSAGRYAAARVSARQPRLS
jgi:hypothetical protein